MFCKNAIPTKELAGHAVKNKGLCTVSTTGGMIGGEWVSGDLVILFFHCFNYHFHSIAGGNLLAFISGISATLRHSGQVIVSSSFFFARQGSWQ